MLYACAFISPDETIAVRDIKRHKKIVTIFLQFFINFLFFEYCEHIFHNYEIPKSLYFRRLFIILPYYSTLFQKCQICNYFIFPQRKTPMLLHRGRLISTLVTPLFFKFQSNKIYTWVTPLYNYLFI